MAETNESSELTEALSSSPAASASAMASGTRAGDTSVDSRRRTDPRLTGEPAWLWPRKAFWRTAEGGSVAGFYHRSRVIDEQGSHPNLLVDVECRVNMLEAAAKVPHAGALAVICPPSKHCRH